MSNCDRLSAIKDHRERFCDSFVPTMRRRRRTIEIDRRRPGFDLRIIDSFGNHPRPPCSHEKLRKNVHEKSAHTLFFSLYISLTRRHARIQHKNQETTLSLSLFPPSILPCVKQNFLKLLDGSSTKAHGSFQGWDGEMRQRVCRLFFFFWSLSNLTLASFAKARKNLSPSRDITASKYRYRSQKKRWSAEIFFF